MDYGYICPDCERAWERGPIGTIYRDIKAMFVPPVRPAICPACKTANAMKVGAEAATAPPPPAAG